MKKASRDRHLVVIAGIAIAALVSVQIYWIRTATRLQKIAADRSLKSDISNGLKNLVDEANCLTLYSRAYIRPGEGIYVLQQRWADSTLISTGGGPDTVSLNTRMGASIVSDKTILFRSPMLADITYRFHFLNRNSRIHIDTALYYRARATANPFKLALMNQKTLTEQLNINLLDGMIRQALSANGLSASFEAGIRQVGSSRYDYLLNTSRPQHLNEASIRIRFLGDDLNAPFELSVWIPDSFKGTVRSLSAILILSLLMMLALISSYAYFVRTILNQKRLSQMKSIFINSITHEFNTPITNINLALENWHDSGGGGKYSDIIAEENRKLASNVEQVLQIALLEHGNQAVRFEQVTLHPLIRKAIAALDLQLERIGAAVSISFAPSDIVVSASRVQLCQAFQNLIDNAIKYRGEEQLHLKISTAEHQDNILIEISDNGIGMSAEAAQQVFEPFFRGTGGYLHNVKGFGLGLSYVQHIVRMHQGSITLKSRKGAGTVFFIQLPKRAN